MIMHIRWYILLSLFLVGAQAACDECDDGICYSDVIENSETCIKTAGSYCGATKMHAFHSPSNDVYKHKWEDSLASKGYYKDPVTGAACPIPYAFATHLFAKHLPIGFDQNSKNPIQRCTKNSDCPNDHYCGRSAHPSYPDSLDQSLQGSASQFCYKNPMEISNVSLSLLPNEKGPKFCNKQSFCGNNAICFTLEGGKQFNGFGSPANGICVQVEICGNPNGSTTIIGALTSKKELCKTDDDCQTSRKFPNLKHTSSCVEVTGGSSIKVCCYEPKKCEYGIINSPAVACTSDVECSKNGSSWCDPKGFCCYNSDESASKCDDGATPFILEPPCTGSTPGDANSGKCSTNPNARCRNSHCCPTVTKKGGKFIAGSATYRTKVKCDTKKMVPKPFVFAQCLNETVTVLGEDVMSEPFENYVKCNDNADCESDGSTLCTSNGQESRCVPNPDVPPKESLLVWIINVCLVLLVGGVDLATFIASFFIGDGPLQVQNAETKKSETTEATKTTTQNPTEPTYDLPERSTQRSSKPASTVSNKTLSKASQKSSTKSKATTEEASGGTATQEQGQGGQASQEPSGSDDVVIREDKYGFMQV